MNTTILILFVLGFAGLMLGGEMLVRGASRLAAAAGIPPLVVGLTVVAFGTSSPEIAVMAQAAFGGQSGLISGIVHPCLMDSAWQGAMRASQASSRLSVRPRLA